MSTYPQGIAHHRHWYLRMRNDDHIVHTHAFPLTLIERACGIRLAVAPWLRAPVLR